MRKYCWIVLTAAAAVLFGIPGSRAGDDKAKDLFDKMEKALTSAKTLETQADAKMELGALNATLKGTLWLAAGNKLRVQSEVKFGDKEIKSTIVSDGTKLKAEQGPQSKEVDTPKELQEDVAVALARVGLVPALNALQLNKKEDKRARDTLKVSDLKLGKKEKINGREAQAIEYQLTVPNEKDPLKATVWVEVKTSLPLQRVITTPKGTITENTTFQVNPKIADDKFQLTK
jgi:outer membrane lipoprotein-sorting protein